MSTWKKVHVEDANTTHGTITATLGDNTTDGAAGSVELVMVDGTGEQELQRQTYTFGSNAFNSTTIGTTTNSLTDGAGIADFTFNGSSAATVAVDIANATDLGSGVASGDLILVADVDAGNAIKRTSVADIVGAVSTGVTTVQITGDSGTNTAQNGAVVLDLNGESGTPISVLADAGGAVIQFDLNGLNSSLIPSGASDYFLFRDNGGTHNKVSFQTMARAVLDGGEIGETTLTSSTIAAGDTFLVADGGRGGVANDISLTQLTAYFNDVSVLTNLATNTDVDVNDANLRARLAALDNSAPINIGDADDDCTVVIRGNLQVDGTTTTVNSTTITVDDINITVASGAANAAAADGAGITVDADADAGYASNPQLQWNATHEAFSQWKMVKGVTGETDAFIAGMVSAANTGALDALTPGIGTLGMVGGDLYIQTA
jgi:hypothetical protein